MSKELAAAVYDTLASDALFNSAGETANVVDVLANLGSASRRIADAIAPIAVPGTDASGGSVSSLTEAAMGITAGLHAVAESLDGIAAAIRDRDS